MFRFVLFLLFGSNKAANIPSNAKVYVFLVIGPSEKLPLVTFGSSRNAEVRHVQHHEEQHRELQRVRSSFTEGMNFSRFVNKCMTLFFSLRNKHIERLDLKQQHEKQKELKVMKNDFERSYESDIFGQIYRKLMPCPLTLHHVPTKKTKKKMNQMVIFRKDR
jgi:hypothetical protein